ncbi:SesA protein [Nannizzia gypsea CBS 118893]|uniref:SesA protein n=1 Tax=Arthroderma gypseum (strain ATCC MYA-4604 / CBS 118893) TaxID=535722 RepID=E4UXQ5_ARTGP|nr:SesA protein [Nannizzia gypsea CBS 118893]EFR01950.1 SesA protein [Nannizzia gypsea CBS 118893]
MRPTKFDDLISGTIASLGAAAGAYDIMRNDPDLPATFHKAGQHLGHVQQALQTIVNLLKWRDLAGDVIQIIPSLEDSSKKAKVLEDILSEVASQPESSRKSRYVSSVRQLGHENTIEALLLGIMRNTCVLGEDEAIKAAIDDQVRGMHGVMAELSAMEPSVPVGGGESRFTHFGSGSQFNNAGSGKQFNNTGSGRQYQAEVMHFKD